MGRLINTDITEEDKLSEDRLRPQRLRDYIGQEKIKEMMTVYIEAAKRRGEPLEPTLVREADGRLEIQEGILKRFESRVIKMDKRNRRAVIELSICGEKKQVQLGIRLPGEEPPEDAETEEPGSGQTADG